MATIETLVISKQRVTDHGEVYTPKEVVDSMLDLVAQEMERFESRVLEPACGNGNFLAEVLNRKLEVVGRKYAHSQFEFERYAIIAICSLYGVDILKDNVESCRKRLLQILQDVYQEKFGKTSICKSLVSAEYILKRNIVWGDALTLRSVCEKSMPIIFSEWSPLNGTLIKRRDFTFHELLSHRETAALPLFSDLGDDVFLPEPVREFPPMNFMRLADAG